MTKIENIVFVAIATEVVFRNHEFIAGSYTTKHCHGLFF